MKLISMTDFVLENKGDNMKYAQFLKQPLKLEMFVPCDDEGNIWKYPPTQEEWEWAQNDSAEAEQSFKRKEYYYQKAKEKVLFEGCSVIQQGENTIVMYKHTAIWLTWTNRIVEDIIKENMVLTTNATKQFM